MSIMRQAHRVNQIILNLLHDVLLSFSSLGGEMRKKVIVKHQADVVRQMIESFVVVPTV